MRYKVELVPADEGFAVACLDLPGCSSQGGTEEEAISNIREAIQKYVLARKSRETLAKVRFVDVPEVPNGDSASAGARAFTINSWPMGLPESWTSHKVEDLFELLDEPKAS